MTILSPRSIKIIAAFLSLFISGWILHYHQPFSLDGLLYLKTAETFLQQNIHAAITVYPWPFYSVLIGLISKITSLSLMESAWCLDTLLIAALVVIFIACVEEMGGNKSVLLWALAVILLFPALNHDRGNILRDFGYYTFALLSFLYFLRSLKVAHWKNNIGWGLSLGLATLFRIEGAVLLLLVPTAIFFTSAFSWQERLKSFIRLHFVTLVVLLAILIWLLTNRQHTLGQLGRLAEFRDSIVQGYSLIQSNWQLKTQLLAVHILPPVAPFFASTFFVGGLVAIFISTMFYALSGVYTLWLIAAGFLRSIPINRVNIIAFSSYGLLFLLIFTFFLLTQSFLSPRYLLLFCLILLLWLPFTMDHVCRTKKWGKLVLLVSFLWVGGSGLSYFGPSQTYVVEGGNWLKKNMLTSQSLYTNDARIAYYAGHAQLVLPSTPTDSPIFKGNVIAILISRHDVHGESAWRQALHQEPTQVFSNSRGDKVLIFSIY